ncbi:uncharacterized protein Z518_09814 [Rhinocladiella mackenziei CBS 650.93]|uniref:Rhinocladiella mackenziei CBS 650.93 unplaced genomic scaffold supercont1.8, whole genome shotgun sequence n=1 Tax=Rhinocladiella mackenziei CBS 650.93 TaxID=1442369 RepID=A0A0D2I4L5_9EURO|nr:uncharacterized protein Z518_09814 [Rhinocladiella mackenziei CBS 650.93]KIX00749.1 hypothetical protein Z518_09814 [Rhinocladiella mackenziei CBS 650.93]
MPQAHTSQEYWLPGYGLSRHIVLRQLQYFLGPSATVRPYSYQGREGYLINGTPLTKEQIEDLRRQSREYERQQTIRMSGKAIATTDSAEPDINEPVAVTVSRRNNPAYSSTSYAPYQRYR